MTHLLNARIESIDELSADRRQRMFDIFNRYYASISFDRFLDDLASKTHVLLLFDQDEKVRGFTTLARYFRSMTGLSIDASTDERQCQVVFSGDTIIEHEFWGQQVLPMAWIEQTGRFKSQYPDLPLYWFLIVKGYRTYRYLSVFAKTYYPSAAHQSMTSGQKIEHWQKLLENLAIDRFGDAYQLDTGCIVFPESRGHLSADWADIPERVKARPDVACFLARNPGYYKGHELACITELASDNLTRRARVAFDRGMQEEVHRSELHDRATAFAGLPESGMQPAGPSSRSALE